MKKQEESDKALAAKAEGCSGSGKGFVKKQEESDKALTKAAKEQRPRKRLREEARGAKGAGSEG